VTVYASELIGKVSYIALMHYITHAHNKQKLWLKIDVSVPTPFSEGMSRPLVCSPRSASIWILGNWPVITIECETVIPICTLTIYIAFEKNQHRRNDRLYS